MIWRPFSTLVRRSTLALAALGLAASGLASAHAQAAPVSAGHLQAELVAERTGIAPGQTVHLALRQAIAPGWHTYWRNPGDSGQATTLTWALPPGWRAGDLVWAAPKRLPVGPLMDYGYEGDVLLPLTLTAPASARAGQVATLKAHAAFLVCKDICVPADADLALALPVTAAPAPADPAWGPKIAAAMAAAPKPAGLSATVASAGGKLRLSVTGAALRGAAAGDAYFYPYDGSVIDHAKPQAVERGQRGLTLTLTPSAALPAGKVPALAGVLAVDGRAFEITARPGAALAGAAGLGPPKPAAGLVGQAQALAGALVLAFAGGLILNLMPCVFPVLSMKAAALARRAGAARAAHTEGLAFLAGVLVAFLVLAGALIAARAAGAAVGWGFQLQSPGVVAGLMLVLLLIALNLSGVFEVGAGLQAASGAVDAEARGGPLGAALTGVLAVAAAAPCTAPFMASAVGFALTQGPLPALAVFAALGLGLAAPFTALSFAPGLLGRLPRPGPWMETLRKGLAFPMYASAAWLAWVFSQQVGPLGLAGGLAAAVLAAFAAWLYGAAQGRRLAGRGAPVGFATAAGAAVLAALAAAWSVADGGPPLTAAASAETASAAELPSEPFSPARLAALRAQGKPVFVNFTAAWCVTCQVNDRLALSGDGVVAAFRQAGVAYLKGDWTNRDADITAALAEHGRAGVPLYLMYPANGGDAAVLPQILTPGIVEEALKKATS